MKKIMVLLFAACAVLACRGQETNDGMKVIAHRGGASLGAENSISCIRKGLLAGPYAVEVDVHLTSDGAVVVCHDETLDRTTDGSGRIENLTLSQVRSVRLKGGEDGETVPTLEEVLAELKGKCILLLEVKKTREGQYAGIEEKIIELLDAAGMREHVILQSFNDSVLERFHSRFGTSVHITPSVRFANGRRGKGRIEIEYYGNEDLDRLLPLLGIDVNAE